MGAGDWLNTLATALTYGGLILGGVSSVWAATHELREEGPGGAKRLTRPGRVALALTLVGFLVSLSSNAVGDQLKANAEARQREADAKAAEDRQAETRAQIERYKTQTELALSTLGKAEAAREEAAKVRAEQQQAFIDSAAADASREQRAVARDISSTADLLLVSQPMRSLVVRWQVPGARKFAEAHPYKDSREWSFRSDDEAKFMDRDLFEDIALGYRRAELLYPFLNFLADGSMSSVEPVAVLLSLDDNGSAILPMGLVPGARTGLLESPEDLRAYRFSPREDVWTPKDTRDACPLPRISLAPEVELAAALSPQCISDAVHTVGAQNHPSAKLPETITIKIVANVSRMPFKVKNVTEVVPGINLNWGRPMDESPGLAGAASFLRLEANGLTEHAVTYEVRRIRSSRLTLHGGQENEPTVYADVITYRGRRTDALLRERPEVAAQRARHVAR